MHTTAKQAVTVALGVALLAIALFTAWQHFCQDPRSKALLRDHNIMLSYPEAVLVITGFTNRYGWTLQTMMSASGATFQKEAGWDTFYSGPYPPPHRHGHLNASDIASVHSIVSDLPPRSDSPPGDRLVLLGFKDRGRWHTRSYDSSALPPQVQQLREILEGSLTNRATNKVTSLDAAMNPVPHAGHQRRGATEFLRYAYA